jgi:hypothetical protein
MCKDLFEFYLNFLFMYDHDGYHRKKKHIKKYIFPKKGVGVTLCALWFSNFLSFVEENLHAQ